MTNFSSTTTPLHKNNLFNNRVKFGNNEETPQYQEGSSSIDFSKHEKTKNEKKGLTGSKPYKVAHKAADFAGGAAAVAGCLSAVTFVLSGFASILSMPDDGQYYPINHQTNQLADQANEIEDDILYMQETLGEAGEDTINARMMEAVYDYLEGQDSHLHRYSDAPENIRLANYINPETSNLTAEQYEEVEALFQEMIASENLDDYKTLSNKLIDDYLIPASLATDTQEDDADVVMYKKSVEEFYDELESEMRFFNISFDVFKGAAAMGLLSLLTIAATDALPKPKED